MSSLVARIRERIAADPGRPCEDVVCPMPPVKPPAKPTDIDGAEAALEFEIPPLLRCLYLEIGNGGFGPHYGLEGVPTVESEQGDADIVVLYKSYSSEDDRNPRWKWPRGLVPLIPVGCNIIECVDFLAAPNRVLVFSPDCVDWNKPVAASQALVPVAPSLEDRLEAWLACERARWSE